MNQAQGGTARPRPLRGCLGAGAGSGSGEKAAGGSCGYADGRIRRQVGLEGRGGFAFRKQARKREKLEGGKRKKRSKIKKNELNKSNKERERKKALNRQRVTINKHADFTLLRFGGKG